MAYYFAPGADGSYNIHWFFDYGPPGSGPSFGVQSSLYYPDDSGIVLFLTGLTKNLSYHGTYSITNASGTVVAGPFPYSFTWNGLVGQVQDLPGVIVPAASNAYGFIVTQDGMQDAIYKPNAGISVFHSVPPVASQASPANNAILATLTPSFGFGFSSSNPDAWGEFGAYQIQVQKIAGAVSVWDKTAQVTSAQQAAKAVSGLVYAGTTLVPGPPPQYQWRVRVQSKAGTWSNYTGWRTFSPQDGPATPINVLPTGLQSTLTPTIGMTFKASIGGNNMAAWQYEILQNASTVYQSGDITASAVDGNAVTQTYGTNNPSDTPATPPALTWGTNYAVRARAKDTAGQYGPWSDPVAFKTESVPLAPTIVSPKGSTISAVHPTLTWKHNSPDGVAQSAVKLWLQTSGGTPVTGYNPKTLSQSAESHAVTETLTDSPATTYQWWVSTEADTGPGYSPQSDHATFTVSPGPTISIDIAPGDSWGSSTLAVTHTIAAAPGSTLVSRRTKLFKADGITLIEDSGAVAISGTSDSGVYTFAAKLSNNSGYYVQSSVTDSNGQTVTTDLIGFSTSFTPPDTLTGLYVTMLGGQPPVERSQMAQLPGVMVGWDAVTPYDAFLHYTVYRQLQGASDWEEIGEITNAALASFIDYTCAHGASYNYNVVQVEDDGSGAMLESEMVDPDAQITVTFGAAAFLHTAENPGRYAELPMVGRKAQPAFSVSYLLPYGASKPIAYGGNQRSASIQCDMEFPWLSGYIQKVAALEDMLRRQIEDGSVLVYRDARGEVMYCVVDERGYAWSDSDRNIVNVTMTLNEIRQPGE